MFGKGFVNKERLEDELSSEGKAMLSAWSWVLPQKSVEERNGKEPKDELSSESRAMLAVADGLMNWSRSD
ncbi:MAG: hypothetical protein PHX84_03625 [Candidatus Shapirobacteria bacterium]|jgi:hypothetical protein|nr:hypothetical protein [Candidatus Shapirobacteria bacterium]